MFVGTALLEARYDELKEARCQNANEYCMGILRYSPEDRFKVLDLLSPVELSNKRLQNANESCMGNILCTICSRCWILYPVPT